MAHLEGQDDDVAKVAPLLDMVGDWRAFLAGGLSDEDYAALRRHERTGWPLGDGTFVARLETALGRRLRPKKPGPKPRRAVSGD